MITLHIQHRSEHNVLQVAVDHLIDHLSEVVSDPQMDPHGVRCAMGELIWASMLKERLAAYDRQQDDAA